MYGLDQSGQPSAFEQSAELAALNEAAHATTLWPAMFGLFDSLAGDPATAPSDHAAAGARLFAREHTPLLASASLGDGDLLAGLRLLKQGLGAARGDDLDWRQLGPAEIGFAYESLLALQPVIERGSESRARFRLEKSRRGLRTGSGSFYTPDALVQHLLDESLVPAIDEACAHASTPSSRRRAILNVRICDPACGSGNFLVPATRRLADAVSQTLAEEGMDPQNARAQAWRLVIDECVYGVDIDPLAVELCKCALWFELNDPTSSMRLLNVHIRCGDALVGATPELVAAGIPDEAYEAREGDDRSQLARIRRYNRRQRHGPGHASPQTPAFDNERADAWCAAFFARPDARADETSGFVTTLEIGGDGVPEFDSLSPEQVAGLARHHRFFHWMLAFPEVFSRTTPGFDVILGNPPFLNQLESATSTARGRAGIIRVRTGGSVKRYVDEASAFLAVCMPMLRCGGRVGLVQPQSVLSAGDAVPTRRSLLQQGALQSLWVSNERVFADAAVFTCAIVLQRDGPRLTKLRRSAGADFSPLSPVRLDCDELATRDSWAELAASAMGIPQVVTHGARTLADIATATADFRDQYYGLKGFLVEDSSLSTAERSDRRRFPPVITSGLIDLAECHWGVKPTRLLRQAWQAPCVDRQRMERDGELGPWMSARLVPKILLATQTRLIEVLVDEQGVYLPSVPVVTVTPIDPEMLWLVAAALASPVSCAEAMRRYGGAALHHDAIKLSARQTLTLPLPFEIHAWKRAGQALREAHRSGGAAEREQRRAALTEFGRLGCEAYGIAGSDDVFAWWGRRLGRMPRQTARLEGLGGVPG